MLDVQEVHTKLLYRKFIFDTDKTTEMLMARPFSNNYFFKNLQVTIHV